MTGICGFVNWEGRGEAGERCALMRRALLIYGSDRCAEWQAGDAALGIGLARLLPEDRFDRQPLAGGGGRWRLVADLRLDNRRELCADLGLSSGQAREVSDSQILLQAWEAWQEETPDRLVGDFAFAVWDAHARIMHLTRDYLGQRPLFYHANPRYSAFSSMARGLHALGDIPLAPNLERIRDFLALAPTRGEGSFFAGISRVEPGETVRLGARGEARRSFWYDWSRRPEVRFSRDADYGDALRATFDRAVEDRLRAPMPVASQLSGGLDSTAVTATAARLLEARGQRLRAYTHVPLSGVKLDEAGGRNGNEWDRAHVLAEAYPNIDHIAVEAADRLIGGDLEAQFHYFEFPALNICNLVWGHEISRLAGRRGRSVLLTGSMGNATISLSGLERPAELFRSGRWISWVRECRALMRNGHGAANVFLLRTFAPFLPPDVVSTLMRLRGRHVRRLDAYSALRAEERDSPGFRQRMQALSFDPTFRPWPSARALSQFMLRRFDAPGQSHKGHLAAFNVDVRDPTCDRRIVEFMQGVPSECLLRDGQPKWLYHQAFADRVPPAIRMASQRGLQGADWRERYDRARANLASECARASGDSRVNALLDVPSLIRTLQMPGDAAVSEPEGVERIRLRLFRALSVAHFIRKTDVGNAAPDGSTPPATIDV
ncbi:MAG: asparagine synthase-related protein [Pseudomonadota bacterium]